MNIRQYIKDEIELLSKGIKVGDDEIIFGTDRLLDSLNVLHILLFLELNFGLKVDVKNLSIDNFNTLNKIVSYVEERI